MTDLEQVARGILGGLQEAVAGKDHTEAAELFHDDVVLFGTAAESVGRAQTSAYLARVLAQDGTIRWAWDRVVPVFHEPGVLVFAAVGTVGVEDARGRPVGRRDAFRLTCVAVEHGGRWRLRHFHGSVPQEG